jgi:hypothetical protein
MDKYTATQWNTAADKEKFVKQFKAFVTKDFPETAFNKQFYNRMSMMRGHIAHYNQAGFYATWFDTSERRADFLRHWTVGVIYGDPAYTWSDVEKVLQAWLQEHQEYEEKQRQQHYAICEDIERKELRRLSAKYA